MVKCSTDTFSGSCLLIILILLFNVILGGFCFDYSLYAILGKDIPWYGDAICGFVSGEIVVPLAIVLWVLSWFGVSFPLI